MGPLPVSDDHKVEIEKRIVEKVIEQLEQNTLPVEDLPKIGTYVLDTIDKVTNHDELIPFLDQLNSQWACFSTIEAIEVGEVKRSKEHDIAQQVLELAKNNKLDEAIALSKSMTTQ